jgi:threonine dehydratase
VAGADVRLKLETLQPTFSYKIRGAFNVIEHLVESAAPSRALVTASAGNHGQALAHAARHAGMALTVYASAQAPRVKLEAMREAGADLRLCPDYDEAERRAKAHGASGSATSPDFLSKDSGMYSRTSGNNESRLCSMIPRITLKDSPSVAG